MSVFSSDNLIFTQVLLQNYLTSYIRVIDIVLAFFLVWGAYKGFKKGFVLELLSIVIFIVGVILIFFGLTKLLTGTESMAETDIPKSTSFFIYLIFYLLGAFLLNSLGRKLQDKIDYSILDDFDNVAGMILGGMKYAVFFSILIGLFNAVGLTLPAEITDDTIIYPKLLAFQQWLVEVGNQIAPTIGDTAKTIQDSLKEK